MVAVRPTDSQGLDSPHVRAVPLPEEVVVIDLSTTQPLARGSVVAVRATDAEMAKAEQSTPDGSAAIPHERHLLPWVVGLLAVGGLLIVGIGMFLVGGVQAMAVGLAWVLAGYATAWIVVWAAGLARAKEEAEIEREIVLNHAMEIEPPSSGNGR